MDIFQLHNVRLHSKLQDHVLVERNAGHNVELSCAFDKLADTIAPLAAKYPLWIFTADRGGASILDRDTNTVSVHIRRFEISHNGEVLGTIAVERYFSSARGNVHRLRVHNQRIEAGLPNKKAYTTEDPKKAIAKVKKTFGKRSVTERLQVAIRATIDKLDSKCYTANNKLVEAQTVHDSALNKFARLPHIYAQFAEHAKTDGSVHHAIERLGEARVAMQTINDMRDKLTNGTATLVLRVENEYVVRRLDNVNIYNDTSLPHELRESLGMLKLCDMEQVIAGIGTRISEDVFLLTPDNE